MAYAKKSPWVLIDKKLPPSNREVLVLCSDGVITQAHCIKRKGKLVGWVYDLFAPPSSNARALSWRKLQSPLAVEK
jgi:hypothetical protein